MRGASGHNIEKTHFVFVKHAFNGAVVHLKAGILGARKVHGFCGIRLHNAADGRAGLGKFKVVARHLHWHALFKIAIGALEHAQLHKFA